MTDTVRKQKTGPQIQQLPLHSEEGKRVKDAFVQPLTIRCRNEEDVEFRRASGYCICSFCHKEYRAHPLGGPKGYDGELFLNRLCNGDLVKL